MKSWEIQWRNRSEHWMRHLEVNYVDIVDRIGLVGLSLRATTHDHHPLVLCRRQQHARRLVAHLAPCYARHRDCANRIFRQIDDAGIDQELVVHTSAVKEDPAIRE